MVFTHINMLNVSQKASCTHVEFASVSLRKCVTLYQVFASRNNVNALFLGNFLSKHICIMHTVLLPFFVARGRGTYFRVPAINTLPLWHTPKH